MTNFLVHPYPWGIKNLILICSKKFASIEGTYPPQSTLWVHRTWLPLYHIGAIWIKFDRFFIRVKDYDAIFSFILIHWSFDPFKRLGWTKTFFKASTVLLLLSHCDKSPPFMIQWVIIIALGMISHKNLKIWRLFL